MATLKLDQATIRIFVGSDPAVTAVTDFNTKEVKTDKATDLPLWQTKVEVIIGDEVEAVNLKIASSTAPTLNARSEYTVDGDFIATPYVNASNRVAISYKVVGTLKPAMTPAAPKRQD